jgi:probable O-glycosylation ligase (exosortase A-associated)
MPTETYTQFSHYPPTELDRSVYRYLFLILLCVTVGSLLLLLDPVVIFAGLLVIGVGAGIFYRPYLGLLFYLTVFLLRPGELFPSLAPLHLERIVGALVFVVMLLHIKLKHGQFRIIQDRINYCFLLLFGAVLLSVPTAFWKSASVGQSIEFAKIAIFYFLIIGLVESERKLKTFVWLFVLLISYLAFDSLRLYMLGEAVVKIDIVRATGTNSAADNYNSLAATLVSTLPFLYFGLFTSKRLPTKILLVALMALFLTTIVLTGSRSGLLGLVSVIAYLWWRNPRKLVTTFVITTVAVIGWLTMGPSYQKRYESIFSGERDESAKLRIQTWKEGIELFFDRPIIGVGAGSFSAARGERFGNWQNPHSLYVQLLSELGIAGTLVFFLLLAQILLQNHRARERILRAGGAGGYLYDLTFAVEGCLIPLFVTGIFGHNLYRYTWYMIGALVVVVGYLSKSHLQTARETSDGHIR